MSVGGGRRMCDEEGLRGLEEWCVKETERLCVGESVLSWRFGDSCTGASPKMKNLIKAPIKMTTESWPSTNPWVKDNLEV